MGRTGFFSSVAARYLPIPFPPSIPHESILTDDDNLDGTNNVSSKASLKGCRLWGIERREIIEVKLSTFPKCAQVVRCCSRQVLQFFFYYIIIIIIEQTQLSPFLLFHSLFIHFFKKIPRRTCFLHKRIKINKEGEQMMLQTI